MKLSDHEQLTKTLFGFEFPKVHEWIDECAKDYASTNIWLHWKERHHIRAIEEKYGSETTEYWVAYFHIWCDNFSRFRTPYVPKDEDEVILWLKDLGVVGNDEI